MRKDVAALRDKGRRSLTAAERLFKDRDYDFAASRAYYAMFYVASALLLARGFQVATHAGVLTLFWEHFVKSGEVPATLHQALHRALDTRTVGDYGITETVTEEVARAAMSDARRFVQKLEPLLTNPRKRAA